MISKCLSVLLLVSAINCGHHVFRTVVPIQQHIPLVPFQVRGHLPPMTEFGPIVRSVGIPHTIGSSLPLTNFGVIPRTVPQYLVSLPRTVNLEIPQSIPSHLLSITAPGAAPMAVQTLHSMPTFISPAEKIRSQPIPAISSTPLETPLPKQTPELVQTPEIASIPRFDSNAYSGSQSLSADSQRSTGFSTPIKPLNFAPNLPEVNKPLLQNNEQISQSVETARDQKLPETVQQKIETPEAAPNSPLLPQLPALPQQENARAQPIDSSAQPLSQQRIDSAPQPLSQQTIDSAPQPLSQQRIDSAPQPLSQQRVEAIPQSINNEQSGTPQRQFMSLSSYSF